MEESRENRRNKDKEMNVEGVGTDKGERVRKKRRKR